MVVGIVLLHAPRKKQVKHIMRIYINDLIFKTLEILPNMYAAISYVAPPPQTPNG